MITLLAVPVACGVLQAFAASALIARFVRQPVPTADEYPPVTVLKPLYGDEPLLEDALASLCRQRYPAWQIVFGVHSADDPSAAVVERLRRRFPNVDMTLVVNPARHGENGKISNLMNMFPAARHDILVIADSDVHTEPQWLEQLVAGLSRPKVGLVTTLYTGLPAHHALPARLGAMQITHGFLPGAVLARALGRSDCLGATMCLRRSDLLRIGGFEALVNHLADDQVLGRRISALGLHVALASAVVQTTVPETSLRALFQHELRWARTVRTLEPLGYAASVLQYPLAWALLAVLLSGGAVWALVMFAAAWLLRALAARGVDRALATRVPLAFFCPLWLLPLREILSVIVMMASYGGRRVVWRGHGLEADTPERLPEQTAAVRNMRTRESAL